jgi:hypothetical protein
MTVEWKKHQQKERVNVTVIYGYIPSNKLAPPEGTGRNFLDYMSNISPTPYIQHL